MKELKKEPKKKGWDVIADRPILPDVVFPRLDVRRKDEARRNTRKMRRITRR